MKVVFSRLLKEEIVKPPSDPEEWSDEEWINYLNETDVEAKADVIEHPRIKKIENSTFGKVMRSAMIGLSEAIFGQQDRFVIISKVDADYDEDLAGFHLTESPKDSYYLIKPKSQNASTQFGSVKIASASDAIEIAQIQVTSFHETYTGLIDQSHLDKLSVEAIAKDWETFILETDLPNEATLIYSDLHERIVGFINFCQAVETDAKDRYGEITAIYVLKEFIGIGLGRQLIDRAVSMMKKANYEKIVLWVLESNERAKGFYSHLGFSFDGTTKIENSDGVELFQLRYVLSI